MPLSVTKPPITTERIGFGALYLGLRRLGETVAVVVLAHEVDRDALARVMGLDGPAFDAALDDAIEGRFGS